jgi:small subunit ribosomal protein S3
VAKCGEPALLYVDQTTVHVSRKSGVLGVTVKIMLPEGMLPDEVKIIPRPESGDGELDEEELEEVIESPIDELIEESTEEESTEEESTEEESTEEESTEEESTEEERSA